MKKNDRIHNRLRTMAGMLLLSVVLAVALFADEYAIVSRADSTGKVTANSVNIRKSPSTSSDTVGTAEKNTVFDIKGQETGSDGSTWYQVSVNGVTGYIRSDLMSVTEGGTPSGGTTSSTPTTSTPDETLVEVTPVEPVSASVTSTSPVRVRQNASTTSRIVTTAQSGLALTVTGKAVGTDGKDWYQVQFIAGGSEVNGFIRKDYVTVSGELVPAGTSAENPGNETPEAPEPEPVKDWDTYYEGGKWHLLNNGNGYSYDIDQIFSSVEENTTILKEALAKNRTQQIVVIILVILLIFMAAAISFLIFKLKDMTDSAYFNEVERETVRRRTADRPVERGSGGQRAETENRRPAGQRPAGGANAQRPAGQGQRPAGGANGQRPAGQGQRPAGGANAQRPAGQGQRPAGGANAQRPAGQRPAGAADAQRPAGQNQRPAGAADSQRPAGQRPADAGQRPANRPSAERQETVSYEQDYGTGYEQEPTVREKPPVPQGKNGWKAKNFINDDEFEFQFLDWEDDQK